MGDLVNKGLHHYQVSFLGSFVDPQWPFCIMQCSSSLHQRNAWFSCLKFDTVKALQLPDFRLSIVSRL